MIKWCRATPTLILLLIVSNDIIQVRLIVIPQLVPPFPIVDVVGFELIFIAIFTCSISEISTLI